MKYNMRIGGVSLWLFALLLLLFVSIGRGQTSQQQGRPGLSSSEEQEQSKEARKLQAEVDMAEKAAALSSKEDDVPPSTRSVLRGRQVQEITYPPRKYCDGIKKIVQCKGGIPEDTCKQELIDNGVDIVSDMKGTLFFAICVDSEDDIDLVSQLTRVENVEDDPPRFLARIHGSRRIEDVELEEQIIPYGVEMVKATEFWDRYGSRGAGIKVCVIDSGLRATHEDLEGADVTGSNDEENFLPWDEDGYRHGTHVTGTIAARDNGVGVVGVAPEVSVYEVRVLDDTGNATVSDLIEAMRACKEGGADVINMSLVGLNASTAEQDYIRELRSSGVLVVASSGNFVQFGYILLYPASYEDVVSVGAVDDKRRIANFSTYNSYVDIVAPGVNVLSMGIESDQSYTFLDGTSMAAPHVSGVAALLWSQFPSATVDDIRNALFESARDLGACGPDRHYGHGVVDVMAAAAYLENNTITSPELQNCVEVVINVTTDFFGDETFFLVTPKGRSKKILYRGGPYQRLVIATYTNTFLLPDGCYDFMLFDLFGDGTNGLTKGRVTVTYNGIDLIDYDEFTGSQETFTFGNCD